MAASGDYLATLKENLSCPLCYEVYNHEERTPKALPCIHTLCLQCLDSYVKKNLEENHLCPLCQTKFDLPKGGVKSVPTNTGLKGMLDLLPKEELVDLEMPRKPVCLKTPSTPVCREHGNAECTAVCVDCKVHVCSECIISLKHQKHDVKKLEDARAALKRDVKRMSDKFENLVTRNEKYINDALAKPQAWKTSVKHAVEDEVNKTIQQIKLWHQDMEEEIEEDYKNSAKDFVDMKINFSEQKKKWEKC